MFYERSNTKYSKRGHGIMGDPILDISLGDLIVDALMGDPIFKTPMGEPVLS